MQGRMSTVLISCMGRFPKQEKVRRPAHDKHDDAFGGKAAHDERSCYFLWHPSFFISHIFFLVLSVKVLNLKLII